MGKSVTKPASRFAPEQLSPEAGIDPRQRRSYIGMCSPRTIYGCCR